MASQLLRVSRGIARAARQAAAPVARLGSSGNAAPSDLPRSRRCLSFLRGGSAVDAPPLGRAMSSHTNAPSPSPPKEDIAVRFVADDKDLESDKALWALYERWCKHFEQERDHDEMVRYFPTFKEAALLVDGVNKANLPCKSAFNQFSDGKLRELCSFNLGDYLKAKGMPYSESLVLRPPIANFFQEDDCPEGTGRESNRRTTRSVECNRCSN